MSKNIYNDEYEYDTYRTKEEIADKTETIRKLTKDERETTINYNEADGFWEIDSSVATHIKKFEKLGYECVSTQYYADGTVEAKIFRVPKHSISFRKPEKVKRQMTDEQKKAMSERVKLMQEARAKSKTQKV